MLTTVYDPTDGTGRLPGLESMGQLPLEYLDRFNQGVRQSSHGRASTSVVADVHRHFLGHGVERARGGALVLAAEPDRAERAGSERDPEGVGGGVGDVSGERER